MFEMYDVLHEKMLHCKKPIFPILPSINTAGAEVAAFLAKGHVNFADEVTLGTALSRIMNAPRPANNEIELFGVDVPRIRRIIDSIPADGYIAPHYVQALLRSAGIPIVEEFVSDNKEEVLAFARRTGSRWWQRWWGRCISRMWAVLCSISRVNSIWHWNSTV